MLIDLFYFNLKFGRIYHSRDESTESQIRTVAYLGGCFLVNLPSPFTGVSQNIVNE